MLNINLLLVTAGNLEFDVESDKPFDSISLFVSNTENAKDIELDNYNYKTKQSKSKVLVYKDSNTFEVDVNMIEFDFIYYKQFYFVTYKEDKIQDKSKVFKIEPKGRKDLYGIVNKLAFDFNRLWSLSGTECALFYKDLTSEPCPDCYDKDLGQIISSECPTCNSTGAINKYNILYFKARKNKTQTQQVVSDKGVNFYVTAMYTTFSRLDFVLGSIMFDLTTREFFEIKNANTASVGGVRTSTQIMCQYIPSNDTRVKPLLKLVK